MDFESWIIKVKQRGDSTARKYRGAIHGRLSEMAIENGLTNNEIWKVHSLAEFSSLKAKLTDLDEFSVLNTKGNNMYSAALNAYGQYLEYQGAVRA